MMWYEPFKRRLLMMKRNAVCHLWLALGSNKEKSTRFWKCNMFKTAFDLHLSSIWQYNTTSRIRQTYPPAMFNRRNDSVKAVDLYDWVIGSLYLDTLCSQPLWDWMNVLWILCVLIMISYSTALRKLVSVAVVSWAWAASLGTTSEEHVWGKCWKWPDPTSKYKLGTSSLSLSLFLYLSISPLFLFISLSFPVLYVSSCEWLRVGLEKDLI